MSSSAACSSVQHCVQFFQLIGRQASSLFPGIQAKLILKNLKANSLAVAADILEPRIAECEHALKLRAETVKGMKIQDLEAHVSMTASVWKEYSIPLQSAIVFRRIQDDMQGLRTLCEAATQDLAAIKKSSNVVAVAMSCALPVGIENSEHFSSKSASLAAVLQRLMKLVETCASGTGDVADLEAAMESLLEGTPAEEACKSKEALAAAQDAQAAVSS